MTRAIVFGCNGYIGQHLVSELRSSGHTVMGIGIEDAASREIDEYRQIDCTNPALLQDLDYDVNEVYVFTGYTGTQAGFTEYGRFLNLNDLVLLNILNAVRLSGHNPRIVFPSTRLVYKGVEKTPLLETAEKEAKTVYAQNKLSCESYLKIFANAYSMEFTVFRICVPFGNMFDGDYSYGTIGFFLNMAKSGKNILLYGDGAMMRTFTHVKDLSAAMLAVVKNPGSVNEVYNIGGNDNLSLLEIAKVIAQKYGVSVEFTPWPDAALKIESGDTIFDDRKLQTLTDFNYTYDLKSWISDLD